MRNSGMKQSLAGVCKCACCMRWKKAPTERIIYPSYSNLKHHANVRFKQNSLHDGPNPSKLNANAFETTSISAEISN